MCLKQTNKQTKIIIIKISRIGHIYLFTNENNDNKVLICLKLIIHFMIFFLFHSKILG